MKIECYLLFNFLFEEFFILIIHNVLFKLFFNFMLMFI